MSARAAINQYQHACVRDLAWALLSPPLLTPSGQDPLWFGPDWCRKVYTSYAPRLLELDRQPAALQQHLQASADKRLGAQFENLLHFWLNDPANPLYRLLAHGLPIRRGKQTLGELDFVVQDRHSGEVQHWEVAIRFYLGTCAGGDHASWIGMDPSDRLDLKVERMREHQLPVSLQAEGVAALRERGIVVDSRACLLKGRLFYPAGADRSAWQPALACPLHGQGWWLRTADFPGHFNNPGIGWSLLPRELRMAQVTADVPIGDAMSARQLLECLPPDSDNRPVAVLGRRAGQEVCRGFLVPPGWPALP